MQVESVRNTNIFSRNVITNAIDVVLGWNLPDESIERAFQAEVGFLAGEGWD